MLAQTGKNTAALEFAACTVLTFASLSVTRCAVPVASHTAADDLQARVLHSNSVADSSVAAAADYTAFLTYSEHRVTAVAF